jgi:hypothetical protein
VSTPHLEHENLVEDRISLLQDFIRLVLLVNYLCPIMISESTKNALVLNTVVQG